MRSNCFVIFLFVLLSTLPSAAFAAAAIFCGELSNGRPSCIAVTQQATAEDALRVGAVQCRAAGIRFCTYYGATPTFSHECRSVAVPIDVNSHYMEMGLDSASAQKNALEVCGSATASYLHPGCTTVITACEFAAASIIPDFLSLHEMGLGLSFGIGFIIAILIYAKRGALSNFVIHGNLPFKLTNYADDVQVLFTRTQRVNWYGRVVFGIVARLGMTEHQLELVRRYWLGRIIAFDSLRRQRQSKLALMHLQLAAQTKVDPKDAKPLSQLWAAIKMLFFVVFYLLRAVVSFLLGLLFIRVTIAKLARGKLVESTNLVLILQAKEAIEQCAGYLKEYLVTAETFDGKDELFEPERPVDTVVSPLHRRGQTQP